jgi:hypothetical protein
VVEKRAKEIRKVKKEIDVENRTKFLPSHGEKNKRTNKGKKKEIKRKVQ